jgi:hypothetical protein
VNFGEDTFYTAGGGGIPEGLYCVYHDAVVHQYEKQDGTKVGPEFLAVRVAAYDLNAPDAEPKMGYYSMGTKAILSYMPNADDDGKSLLAVPGGPATSMNDSSNWNLYRKSFLDSGMPAGTFTNDLRALDGTWVHLAHIPEPESRKTMGAATGEAGPEERRNRTIAVVSEILDGGKPWEGTGGLPTTPVTPPVVAPATVTRMAPRPPAPGPGRVAPPVVAPHVAPRPPALARTVAPPPAPVESAPEDDEVLVAAQNAAAAVIEKSPTGLATLVLKTGIFKEASKTNGGGVAQRILNTYFADEAATNSLLGTLGYAIKGARVEPA